MIYDLFISFKSEDATIADNIRKGLLLRNSELKIFWSEVTLCEIGNSDFSKVIEEAISSSKNMCVVGSTIENISSNWVQYEWRLFKHCQLNDKNNFYNNLFLAVCDIDPMNLPLPLQLCECLSISDYEQIYQYVLNENHNITKRHSEKRGIDLIQDLLLQVGWNQSLFLSSSYLSDYEMSIQSELDTVTIISHSLLHDSPGGDLFDTVKSNLKQGIYYNYIFLDSSNAYGVLRKIYKGHSASCRDYLILEMAEDSFWIFGKYANLTIYEFNNGRASEGYLRILMESSKGVETPIYLKMSEEFIDSLWNHIEKYRIDGLIKQYGGIK